MRTTKLVLGIISLILCVIVFLGSCAMGIYNTLENTGDNSEIGLFFVFLFMLVAGIVGIATRKYVYGGYTAAAFYLLASIVAFTETENLGVLWILCFIFAAVFFIGSIYMKEDDEINPSAKSAVHPQTTANHDTASSPNSRNSYCGKCGKRFNDNDIFCVRCGNPRSGE